ncbi:hypothetical protein GGR10_001428, partial [Bartonella chomelii]
MGIYAKGGESLTMTLDDVTVEGVQMGVYMGRGKNLMMTGGSTVNFMGDGVGVMVGGEMKGVSLNDVTIRGSGSGVGSMGVYVMGTEDMTMTLTDVTISRVGMGVVVGKGKNLMIGGSSRIEFMGTRGYGVYVGEKVKGVSLKGTVIKGQNNGVGVYAVGTEKMTMTLTDVMISKVGAGVYVKRGKSLTIGGSSRIEFTDGYGVYVGEGVESASLKGTRITGKGSGMGTGVIMESSGKMTLENVTISKVQTGVYAENG